MPLVLPPNEVVAAIEGSVTRVNRRVEFYEFDGETPWEPEGVGVDAPLLDGSVTIDASRDERRNLQLRLHNEGDLYRITKERLWYDKVIKVYRGVDYSGGTYESLLGSFYIDTVAEGRFPKTLSINARDRTKILRKAKFGTEIKFQNNHPVRDVLIAIAVGGGIPGDDIDFPLDMGSLYQDTYFDPGDTRWSSMKEIATAFKYDLYFQPDGTLFAREFADPATQTPEYTFQTGEQGNISEYGRKLSDELIRNHIVVTGQNANDLPIYAEAENTNPDSPTSIQRIGRRTEVYESSYIGDVVQAQELADVYLSISGLEQYELDLDAIVVPYMDAGIVVAFKDPEPIIDYAVLTQQGFIFPQATTTPLEFLLQKATIPLSLGTMSVTAGRVTLTG